MRSLVTGGLGFIGVHLCRELLARGDKVVAIDSGVTATPECVRADITSPQLRVIHRPGSRYSLDSAGSFDRVFYLAGIASPRHYITRPRETCEASTYALLAVLDRASGADARVVFTSSSEVYGEPAVSPQTEDYRGNVNSYGPRSVYDEGKRIGEALCFASRAQGGDTRVARLFNTYGPGMRLDDGRAVPEFVRMALSGAPLVITGGAQTRCFCYVSDTVRALIALSEVEYDGSPVNIGNPHEAHSISALAGYVATEAASRGIEVTVVKRGLPQDDPTTRLPAIEKARTLLGWAPTVTLATGLARVFDDFDRRIKNGQG